MKQIKVIRILILAVAFFSSALVATAQVSISSPYSLFGIGNLYGVSSQNNMALGGAATAFSSPFFINPANPASYIAFDTNSFVFDAAFNLRTGTLKTIDASQKTRFGSISNLYFGLPVTKWWRASLGVMPYSNVGYDMESSQIVTGVGNQVNVYKGYGGLNKAYFGSAISPVKNLSIGFNVSYIFGNIVKERAVTFPDSVFFFNTMARSTARLSKVNFDFGLIYRKNMKEGRFFQVGLTLNPKQSVDGHAEKISYSYQWDYTNDLETVKDTISIETGNNGVVVLPTSVGAGFMIGSSNRWFATADVNWQKWSEFRYLGDNPGLKDNLRVSVGGQFRPSAVDMGKYYQRINYRAGFRYEQSYLEINQTRINDFGISFGVGLPMKKSRSTINIAVEIGSQGTTQNNLVKENYMRLTIGSSIQERWFLKRKFN